MLYEVITIPLEISSSTVKAYHGVLVQTLMEDFLQAWDINTILNKIIRNNFV